MGLINIRLVKRSDLSRLATIYAKTYRVFVVGERWTPKSAIKLMFYWMKRQPDLFFVAEYESKIVGAFVAGIKPWWDGNHLVDGELFVDPDFQKKGIGKKLSKQLYMTAIKKYDVVRFDTYTFKMTKFPLEWYKSIGFTEIKEWAMISADLKTVLKKL